MEFSKQIKNNPTIAVYPSKLQFDNGKELINEAMRQHCTSISTEIQTTAPYSSQQNGIAERLNRTLVEQARCMIHGHPNTKDKLYLWEEAVAYACMIKNAMPTFHQIRGWFIPYSNWHRKDLTMDRFQLFGSTCHVLIQRKGQDKLAAKTRTAIFTGLSKNSGGVWCYLALPDRAIRESRNVFFPKRLPLPDFEGSPPPLGLSEESEIEGDEEWTEVELPSEGENKPNQTMRAPSMRTQPSTQQNSTKHTLSKGKGKATQVDTKPTIKQEHTPNKQNNKPALYRPPHLKNMPAHRNQTLCNLAIKNAASRKVLQTPRYTQSNTASATVPKNKISLNAEQFIQANWVCAIAALSPPQKSTEFSFRDPDDIDFMEANQLAGKDYDEALLPESVHYSLAFPDHDDTSPEFDAWLERNWHTLHQPTYDNIQIDDNLLPPWSQAINNPEEGDEWIQAAHTEMEQLWHLKVFEEVPRSEVPEGEPIIPTHFVTKKKLNQFGLVKQYKARCVANRKRRILGVSFDKHASSTPSLDSVRASLAVANHFDMDIDLVDIVGAYTHAPLDRVIYCNWPLGFDKGGPTVMKVNKALYGFVQSGRKCQDDQNIKLEGAGYKQNPMDTSVFYRCHEKVLTILVPYFNNFLVISTKGKAKKIKEELAQLFEIKDEGETKFYLKDVVREFCQIPAPAPGIRGVRPSTRARARTCSENARIPAESRILRDSRGSGIPLCKYLLSADTINTIIRN
ncbi:Copia-like polyprotein/retrotransposon [Ceratobasidium sp. AG-Ba]|nr:Copia-like polyprotein/retrotransposon [Ceratobasidium sp. AG-Ba]